MDQVFQTTWEGAQTPPSRHDLDELVEEGFWASDPHNPGAYVWWTEENDGEYYHQDSLGTY